ncbi:F-box-like protein [Ceratobasidium sp. AG-Ba]|nr:F-box-like protein [Ceratobasidium sp. AG-Ba]
MNLQKVALTPISLLVRSHLSSAVKTYLAAPAKSTVVCTQTDSEMQDVQAALSTMDQKLDEIVSEENPLRTARTYLTTVRNSSTTLIPFRSLPPEILSKIFLTLNRSDSSRIGRVPNAHLVAAVSSYWRQVAINEPRLWTDVNIKTSQIDCDHALALVGRSKHLPLRMYFFEPVERAGSDVWQGERHDKAKVFLEQIMPRVESLELDSHSCSTDILNMVLGEWIQRGSIAPGKKLCIRRLGAHLPPGPISHEWEIILDSFDHAESVLLSVTHLQLEQYLIPWNSKAYENLLDLQLLFHPDSQVQILVGQMAKVFSASPRLKTLKIAGLEIRNPGNSTLPMPSPLNDLDVLVLCDMLGESWTFLARLISLAACTGTLKICIEYFTHESLFSIVSLFINRAVKTMILSHYQSSAATPRFFSPILRLVPSLDTLVLAHCDYSQTLGVPAEAYQILDVISEMAKPRHDLQNLYLFSVRIDRTELKHIVSALGVRNLHFGYSESPSGETQLDSDPSSLKAELLEEFPSLVCRDDENFWERPEWQWRYYSNRRVRTWNFGLVQTG